MVDYIVVGLGLAGTCFCETLRKNHKSFVVINNTSQVASKVAGGIINPVILKRFTLSWRADEQLPVALEFYKELEKFLNRNILHKRSVLRRFTSIEEQNLWFEASDKKALKPFLDTKILVNTNAEVHAPFGCGKVRNTFQLNTKSMLAGYQEWLQKEQALWDETFEYQYLDIQPDGIQYKGKKARHIVFAEGYGLVKNPFFNYLPMQGSKGEYITVASDNLKEQNLLKSSIFLIPLEDNLYKVGATYNGVEKDNFTTENAKEELQKKLEQLLKGAFKVRNQEAGVRPTVKDRRPLVGRHPNHERLWVLNGFGSHGILIGPWASKALFKFIEIGAPILPEMNINRF